MYVSPSSMADSTARSLASSPRTALKVVDFKPFLDGHDKRGVGLAVLESLKTIGFVYLVNHGIPEENIALMFDWVRLQMAVPVVSIFHPCQCI